VLKRILARCESKCDASNMMAPYLIDEIDFCRRRFAFIVGNDSYANVQTLSNCISGAKAIAIAVKALGFLVYKNAPLENQKSEELKVEFISWTKTLPENAVALVYAAGHGMELRDRYLLPIDFELEESGEVDENFVLYERNVKTRSLSLRWMQARLNASLRHTGLHMIFWDCCRENVPEYAEEAVLVRTAADTSVFTEHDLNKEWEKWVAQAKILEEKGALHGGYCEEYIMDLSRLQVKGEKLLSQFNVLESSISTLRGTAENDSMIPGAAAKRAMLAKMSPSNLPGMLTLYAPAKSCLALDDDGGGRSPLVSALLSWFGNAALVRSDVLSPEVRQHVDDVVQTSSGFKQQPQWNHSGKTTFHFSEEQ